MNQETIKAAEMAADIITHKQKQIDELVEGIDLAIQILQDNENFMANTAKGALTGLIQKHKK